MSIINTKNNNKLFKSRNQQSIKQKQHRIMNLKIVDRRTPQIYRLATILKMHRFTLN